MADLNYKVSVNTADATRNLNALKGALGGLAAAFSIRQITQFGDSITNLQNKLRTLTPSTALVERQFAAIADIANSSRSDLAATGDLYFRIARSADELGISLADAAGITDTLAKGMAASGLSAAEAAGPLLQIGQALQSGRFQGDELRSVLEGMPVVARALADEMGVPIGQLKKLGSEGKITADVFVRAMQKARAGIDDAFNRTLPTVGQSLNVLQTQLARFFAEFDKSTGATASLAQAIIGISTAIQSLTKNIDSVVAGLSGMIKILAAVGTAMLVFGRAIPAVGRFVDAIVLMRNNLRLAGGVMGVVGTQLSTLGGNLTSVAGSWIRLAKGANTLSGALLNTGAQLARFGLRFLGLVGVIYSVVTGVNDLIRAFTGFDVLDFIGDKIRGLGESLGILKKKQLEAVSGQQADIRRIDNAIEAQNRRNESVKAAIKLTDEEILKLNQSARAYYDKMSAMQADLELRNSLVGASEREIAVTQQLSDVGRAYAEEAIRLTDAIAEARAKGTEEEKARIPVLEDQLRKLSESYNSNAESIRALVEEQQSLVEARKLTEFSIQREIDMQKQLRAVQDEIAKLSMTEIEQKYYDIKRAAEESAIAAIKAEEARRGAPLSTSEIDAYYSAANRSVDELIAKQQELYDKNREFGVGWKQAMDEYVENAGNGARQARDIFTTMTSGMENAIDNFVKTGKLSFKSLIQDIVSTILKSQVRQLVASIFGGGGGGGGGSILSSLFAGFFAKGGTIPPGQVGVVGESGPELVTGPATVTPMGAAGASTSYVTYNITAVDTDSFRRLVASDPEFIFAVTEKGRRSLPGRN